ncbi:hypothetical protein B0H14DRAFT_3452425 [Mycena olivaceomarginata]|nr:hypothetical protein B0H14DRAFT_3452425 [Mycena olivaceomarginata]
MSIHPPGFPPASPIDPSLTPFLTMGPPPNFRPSIDYHISERLPAGGPAICSSSRETYTTNSASPDPISFEAPALRPQTFAVNAVSP